MAEISSRSVAAFCTKYEPFPISHYSAHTSRSYATSSTHPSSSTKRSEVLRVPNPSSNILSVSCHVQASRIGNSVSSAGEFQFYYHVLLGNNNVNNLWSGLNPCAFATCALICCSSGGSMVQGNPIVK